MYARVAVGAFKIVGLFCTISLPAMAGSIARHQPPPAAGGIVNLGVWLALQAPEPVTVRAEARSLWAEVTASIFSSTWSMGNGDAVTCDGVGVAIVDLDTVEQGPCGYTYRASSPEDAPVERTATVICDVDEIPTVGISN